MSTTFANTFAPPRIYWSLCHTGIPNRDYIHQVIDRAAAAGVQGVELSGQGIGSYIHYRGYPRLAGSLDLNLDQNISMMTSITEHAHSLGLRFGLWHHEIDGPSDLLDRLPELRADDGLIDLDSPDLYRFITGNTAEFLDQFPYVDEIVLTMTETRFPVFRRPFCDIPIATRVERIFAALLAAIEPRGKLLVVRPFSAIREDELYVREAANNLESDALEMMYKTEPFDWHPHLPHEPLIGSLPQYPARAETDSGAEYYGMGAFPCSYLGHIERRLTAAMEKQATTAIIRVDRGALHPALGHPVNEANVVVATRWLQDPSTPLEQHWDSWCRERHGAAPKGLFQLLEKTFDVIKQTLYLDGHVYSHVRFPNLYWAKYGQLFSLLEESIPLVHLKPNWGVLSDRVSRTHEEILAEKENALSLATQIVADFAVVGSSLPSQSFSAIQHQLERLPLLARAALGLFKVALSHLQEVYDRTPRLTRDFALESADLTALADQIAARHGDGFWIDLPDRLRAFATELAIERQIELPLRQSIESDRSVIDYILCGCASEGHRLSKMLHSGKTGSSGGRFYRETGIGPDEGFGYLIKTHPAATRLSLTVCNLDGSLSQGRLILGTTAHTFEGSATLPFQEFHFPLPTHDNALLPVAIISTALTPCRISLITVS